MDPQRLITENFCMLCTVMNMWRNCTYCAVGWIRGRLAYVKLWALVMTGLQPELYAVHKPLL